MGNIHLIRSRNSDSIPILPFLLIRLSGPIIDAATPPYDLELVVPMMLNRSVANRCPGTFIQNSAGISNKLSSRM